MSNVRITVVASGLAAIQDLLGIEAAAKPGTFVSANVNNQLVTTFEVTGATWTRLRPQLNALANQRIPALDINGVPTGKRRPLLSYFMEWIPGNRPRINQIEGLPLVLAAPTDITVRGTGLLAGTQAELILPSVPVGNIPSPTFYSNNTSPKQIFDALRIRAIPVGPFGNLISVSIAPAEGAGSVTTTMPLDGDDGEIKIRVVPAAGLSTSTAIAAQINGSAPANTFVTATALVPNANISPTNAQVQSFGPLGGGLGAAQSGYVDRIRLKGGDGGGLAYLNVPVTPGVITNRLNLVTKWAGNDRNDVTLTIVASGVPGVAVVGNDITVTIAGVTETLANIAAAINGSAPASALVTATAVGAGSLGAMVKTWLYGGGGERVVATIGGAVTTIKSQTDTSMVLSTTNLALAGAGVNVGETVLVQLLMNYGNVQASLGAVT